MGRGVVFELSPPTLGQTAWTETALYAFHGVHDGYYPSASLIADGSGNLYGTTVQGGASGDGIAFELSPPANGGTKWNETVLYTFSGAGGEFPGGGLLADGTGNLYGTASSGGSGTGVVFKLSPPPEGQMAWTETVLYTFGDRERDGYYPSASLIADGSGNLYGTTAQGGSHSDGTVFKLTP